MRVLLADDHPRVRRALRMFIEEEPGLSIIGEVSEAETLLSQALALQPDIILLEWELEGWPADKLLSALRALGLPTQVIVLSGRPETEHGALAAGADGFVGKADGPEQLLAELRRLMKEEMVYAYDSVADDAQTFTEPAHGEWNCRSKDKPREECTYETLLESCRTRGGMIRVENRSRKEDIGTKEADDDK